MSKPQQQELGRSRRTPADQNSFEEQAAEVELRPAKRRKGRAKTPEENTPGHHPRKDQDKPPALGGAGHGAGKRKRRG